MNLLKDKLLLIWKRILQAYADYRVTVSATVFLTIYAATNFWLLLSEREVRERMLLWKCFTYDVEIIVALLLFIFAAMFTESVLSYREKGKRVKAARFSAFIFAGLLAVAVSLGLSDAEPVRQILGEGSAVGRWLEQFVWGYVLLLLLGTVYFCHKRSGVGFISYMLHVLVNGAIATVVCFVLYIGVTLILAVVETLFMDNAGGNLAIAGTILITGLYYAPACMNALNNTDSKIDDPLSKFLIRYVMTGMTICALAIVYAYLLKILILWEIPSNELFGIITGLFVIGMPIWVIDYHYRDESGYMRLVQKLPYVLIPLIPVQIYAIGVRIYDYGMTPSRYMGVLIVFIEMAVLLIWHFWRDHMERTIPVLCICVIVSFIVPGINGRSLSNRWQQAFLETYYHKLLEERSLTETEVGRLKGAYAYLKKDRTMTAVLNRYDIYEESFASMLADTGADMERYTKLKSHSVHCCQMVGNLDVAAYNSFAMLNQDELYDGDEKIPVDFSAFRFYKRETGPKEIVTADLSDFAKRCMAYEKEHPDATTEEYSAAMKPYRKIMLDDGGVLYLNHFKVSWQDGIKDGEAYFNLRLVDISGMLLER